MNKFISYLKNNIVKVTVVLVIICCTVYIISDTYAADTYTVIFNRYEDTEIMDKCETDVNGKLEADCIAQISKVCNKWSPQSQKDGAQTEQIPSSEFANMIFSSDTEYYCVSGSSLTYDTGCYACKADETIVHWAASGAGNDACPGGYTKIHENIDECKVYACYECSDNKNIMEWRYSAISDDNCPSGYNRTTKTQEECKTIIPDACYVCNNDNNVMKWDNNGDADSSCSSGYSATDKPQNECKTIIPDACYECKDNKNIMKWDNDGSADINCSSGYIKVDKTEAQCVPVDNPKTGNIMMFVVWVIGLGAVCYSIYYLKKMADNN